MGTRGPKPLPDNVHILNGNPSKKRLAVLHGGARVPVEVPDAPSHLTPGAKKEWKRITLDLEKLGLIAKIDRAALGVYCEAYDRWAVAGAQLKKLGVDGMFYTMPSGYQQHSVWLQISNRSIEIMHKFLQEFGMTPSARSRVDVTLQQDLFGDDSGREAKPAQNPAAKYFTDR